MRYYLEYHDADRLHSFGYRQPVDADSILLGRDELADIRFYDDSPTVSRRHAVIRQDGGQLTIEPISQTNSTLINGRRIYNREILRNGDEIRLSTDGPRLGVIIPQRATLFPNSPANPPASRPGMAADRPSRQTNGFLWGVLATIVIIAAAFGIWKIAELTADKRPTDNVADSLQSESLTADSSAVPSGDNPLLELPVGMETTPEQVNPYSIPSGGNGSAGQISIAPQQGGGAPSEAAMKAADRSVYYVMALGFEVTTPSGEHYEIECGNGEGQIPGWSGTGFLLSDGRFVTARHVVEPWFYLQSGDADSEMLSLNLLASNGGKVVSYLGAVSPTGDKILFKSTDCRINRSGDTRQRTRSGERVVIAPMGAGDFATYNAGRQGGLPFSAETSRNLRRGTRLTVLSFPLGLGANSYNDINPVYGTATVAADGLQEGMILTTETTYEKGSSGGPVFVTDSSGRLVVVGITSAIAGRSTGFIEPIASIR